jgi:virginiamycin B lyase
MRIPQAPSPTGRPLRALASTFLLAAVTLWPVPAAAQVAGQNMNMVSGTQWPGGDPFLQRQNEPSVAVSSRNPRHLLAGANDYRSVDLPFSTPNAPETGDAWLGVFKSFDGGVTWKSTLLPGYPQQVPRTGPLSTFTTAADPVVRAGTNGLFYYSGIAFNRDTKDGVVFVARFMDLNNKENGDPTLYSDPIRYIDTKVVDNSTTGTPFIDKPWIAVDKPRLLDGVCNLTIPQPRPGNPSATVSQSVPAGAVYAAWTEATGTGGGLTTNVFFSASSDCGGSWSRPVKLNDTNKVNQGVSIAIDPATGVIYVVWRRFASGSQTNAIMMTKSFRGRLFSNPAVVVSLPAYPTAPSFFDQGTSADSFRTNAYPTIGIDRRPDAGSEDDDEPDTPAFRGKVFVAWSQRGVGSGGDARVVLSVSTDGGSTWSAPAPVDNATLTDDTGTSFSRGHQFMPQMTVTADKVAIIYYDARLDHTFGLFSPRSNPLLPDPVTGKLYLETRALRGELLDVNGAASVFTPFFVETGMTEWRHTLDLRVAQADSAVHPAFTSARLSQYIFGTRGDETGTITALQQLQIDPPNLRLFQQGSVPFIGDYIDVAGQTFLPPRVPGLRWRFNSLPGSSPVFLATWTSNQDVRPPLDGDWTHYTPPGSTTTGVPSVFNPALQRPPCVSGHEGMRNQNIYAARISQGLAVTSIQNAKPLSSTLQRALTLSVENLTPLERTFRLTIAAQPTGGRASFVPAPNPLHNPLPSATTTLDAVIPANSAVARSVYALSTDSHARVEVDVAEVDGPPGHPLKPNGLTGFVIFNTDPSTPNLIDPDGTTAPSVTTVEIYNPNVTNPNVTNPNVTNPNVTNPNVTNPNVTNPNVTNPNVTNPNVTNPDLANPNVTNPNVTNPNVTNPNVTNPNVTNPNVTNAPVSDATYTVTNTGNTAATYHLQLAGTAPAGTPLQIIITKPYATPASLNCVLFEQQHNVPIANVVNLAFVNPNQPPNPAITDPSDGNATFVLGPGESILVTIRGPVDVPTLTNILQNVAPVIVAHAPNTNDTTNRPATSPPVITTSALPDGVVGLSYSAPMTALGGTRPYTVWTATGLPAVLSINGSTGLISGTPSTAGTFAVGVSVTDSASKTGNRAYTLRIANPLVITTASLPNGSVGIGYSQPLVATGGLGTDTWSLASGSLPPGIGLSAAGILSGTPTAGGTYPFTVRVTDAAAPPQNVTRALTITAVSAGPPTLVITGAPTNVVGGQPFAISVNVKDGSGSPIVGASVSLSFATRGCLGGLGAALSGTVSALTGATGDAGFPGVLIDRGGPGFTIRAAFGAATDVTGPIFVEGFCTTGNLTPSRYDITLTNLADGRVLLTGGIQPGSTNIFNTAVVYDASTGQFTPAAGTMTTTRAGHRAVLLPSGKVLLAGGFSGPLPPGPPLLTAELFDPLSQTFALTAGLPGTSRSSFRAIWVPGISKVLIVGGTNGIDLASAELYDPATDAFSPTNPMTTPRFSHTADVLPDGRILVVGGFSGSATLATAEIWDPTTGTFAPTGSLHSPRASHASATLSDGRVLVAGGVSTRGGSALATAEIYDPVTATFTPTAAMTTVRSEPLLSVLPSGKVLVAGGWDAANATLTSAELFDPAGGVFTATGSSWAAHSEGEAVLLSTGNVLIAGGWTGFGAADLFYPTPPTITEFLIPTSGSSPDGIAAGPDGALWFTESGGKIGRITTDGVITEFPVPTANSQPHGIAAGPDGAMWFTENYANQIGRITMAGVVTEFSIPTAGGPWGIAAGPDGNLWFTGLGGQQIGRITTDGVISEFPVLASFTHGIGPFITSGPDGALWFPAWVGGAGGLDEFIARITTAGVFAVGAFLHPPGTSVDPWGIAAGPDGNFWVTELSGNRIDRVTTAGVVTAFPVPTPGSEPWEIANGPDGNVWFTESVGNQIGRITTAGVITEFPLPAANCSPRGIAAGPDGAIWFTETWANKIGRLK